MSERIVILTDAPEIYDSFGTETLAVVGGSRRGNPVRRVAIEAEHHDWQTGRYASGLYAYTSDRVSAEFLAKIGDWTLTAEQPR